MQGLNFTLETINGSVSILSFLLLFFLVTYLKFDVQREGFEWKNWLLLSSAVALVVSLLVEKIGTFTTRTVIWLWRSRGGNIPFTASEDFFLIAGASITAIGIIMTIRILSRPRFGNLPWVAATLLVVDYVLIRNFIHFM